MTLRREQKAERRTRILAAGREIIAERGYEALTMRDLARASGVTVPTIYNLIGSKEAVLFAAVEEQTAAFVAGIEATRPTAPAARILSVVEACARELSRLPDYYKSLLRLLLTSQASREARDFVSSALGREFERALEDMRSAGELADWIDIEALAERLTSHMNMTSLQWAAGELDSRGLGAAGRYGACLMLMSVTRGASREHLEGCAASSQDAARPLPRLDSRARHARAGA